MKRTVFIMMTLLFIFISISILYGEDDLMESAKKAGFEEPAEGNCPSCGKKIIVDLSAETSQCPYCDKVFRSELASERGRTRKALPYEAPPKATVENEALYTQAYQEGYADGFKDGYQGMSKRKNTPRRGATAEDRALYEQAYKEGYEDGYKAGHREGLKAKR